MADAKPSEESFGLIQLWPSSDSSIETEVDVVAVHGLGGHPYKTWTEGESLWLRDFLPSSVPEARIFTYGYDSGIAFDKSASEISDFARDLLERLRAVRRKASKTRPIVFVCHSLGGIVFKKALVIAHEREPRYGKLLKAVKGVIFMGTPHRGADVAYWSRILGKIANFPLLGSIRTNLLKDLEPKSKTLGEICSQFVERGKQLQIFTFYERVKMSGINALVVDEDSAVLHLPNETPIPMEADHRNICKFLTKSSQRYELVLNSLQELIEGGEESDESNLSESRAKFLETVCDFDPSVAFNQITNPHPGTCHWVLSNSDFQNWINSTEPDSHNARLMWVSGFAGSGKSTLAKYIVTHLERNIFPVNTPGQRPQSGFQAIAFVCGVKRDLGKHTGAIVLRSILYQFLLAQKSLFHHINQGYLKSIDPLWSLEILEDCIVTLLSRGHGIKFWVIIDALDEMPEQHSSALTDSLKSILERDITRRLSVLVTDRRGPLPSDINGIPELVSMNLDTLGVHEDVRKYIEDVVDAFGRTHEFPQTLTDSIQLRIISRSKGVFLLASLNWTSFSEGVSFWSKRKVMERLNQLNQLPSTFEDLYCNLLGRLGEDDRSILQKIFIWLLAAKRPLLTHELQFAVSLQSHHLDLDEVEDELGLGFEETLRTSCANFVKINSAREVHFRHQSVMDILEHVSNNPENEEILRQVRTSMAASHYHISSVCLRVFGLKDLPNIRNLEAFGPNFQPLADPELQPSTPAKSDKEAMTRLMRYSALYWADHFEHVQHEPEIVDRVVEFFLGPTMEIFALLQAPWSETSLWVRRNHDSLCYTNAPRLQFLIHLGDFVEVASKVISKRPESVNLMDAEGMTPLHWSVIFNRAKVFHRLLKVPSLNPNQGFHARNKPLHLCVRFERAHLVSALLRHSSLDVNSRGEHNMTALSLSLRELGSGSCQEQIIDALLNHKDISLNVKDHNGMVPLLFALSSGNCHSATLKLLNCKRPINIGIVDANGYNTLAMAAMRGWIDVVEIIQSRSGDDTQLFAVAEDGLNTLSRAAYFGQKELLKALLSKASPDEVRQRCNQGRFNLLNLCAQQDWGDLVHVLGTKYGLQIQTQDNRGRTVLHWAAISGWTYLYSYHSVGYKAIFDAQDLDGCTALHLAAENRNLEAAKYLVKEGANYMLREKSGKSPVHVAAQAGSRAILEFFLGLPTREYGRDKSGCGLLHYIATWEWPPVLYKYLRQKRPLLDIVDKNRRTPLHYAAIYGNFQIVQTLLNNDADIYRRDCLGFTPLHHAVQQGHESVMKLLILRGADISQHDAFRRTTLQIAVGASQNHLVQYLLEQTVDVNSSDWKGRTALHQAVMTDGLASDNDPWVVPTLLSSGADPNEQDINGFTPIHFGVIAENETIVELLLKQTNPVIPSLSLVDYRGCTPLDWADVLQLDDMAEMLQSRGFMHSRNHKKTLRDYLRAPPSSLETNVRHDWVVSTGFALARVNGIYPNYALGETHIHAAASHGNISLLRDCIQRSPTSGGDELNHRDLFGWTPLHLTAAHGHTDAARLLLDSGCDVNRPSRSGHLTALHIVAVRNHSGVAFQLLEAGADIDALTENSQTPWQIAFSQRSTGVIECFLKHKTSAKLRLTDAACLLHWAIASFPKGQARADIVSSMVLSGTNVNARDKHRRTPLHSVIEYAADDICETLLRHGADCTLIDDDGQTPLVAALKKAKSYRYQRELDERIIRLLLNNSPDSLASTPALALEAAIGKLWTEELISAELSARSIRIQVEEFSESPQKILLASQLASTIHVLLEAGLDVNLTDQKGETVLHKAVQRVDSETLVQYLIEHDANVNSRNNFGETPLILAAANFRPSLPNLSSLLKAGASTSPRVTGKRNYGMSALDFAKRQYWTEGVALLESHVSG